jgi:PleD family two-component response regulator
MNMIVSRTLFQDREFPGTLTGAKQGVVVVVSDDATTIEKLVPVCDFLDLRMEVVLADMDIDHVLREQRPMAVIADVECSNQDGFHTMRQVARHDRDLPILLLTEGDAAMMGAADAVQELLGLTSVTNTSGFPVAGQLVAFLFAAGRRAGCMRLVPV